MGQTEMIHRCQQGDRQALGLLYGSMHDELLAICRRYVSDTSTAEDLLHDSFLLIFSKIGDLRSADKAHAWMRKVARNVALHYVQNSREQLTVPLNAVNDHAMAPVATPVSFDELMQLVDQLPEGYRRVFRLSVLEGLSHQQIATLLNIEPHSSSSQLYRAKRMLRQSLSVLLLSLLAVLLPWGVYRYVSQRNDTVATIEQSPTPVAQQPAADDAQPLPAKQASPAQHAPLAHRQASAPLASARPLSGEAPARPLSGEASARPLSGEAHICAPDAEPDAPAATDEPTEAAPPVDADNPSSPSGPRQSLPTLETPDGDTAPQLNHRAIPHRYEVTFAYNGLPDGGDLRPLPYGADGMNGETDSVAHHRPPLTAALDVRYKLSPRWSLDGGLRYTLLSSEVQDGNTYLYLEQQQRVRYLGLSLGTHYRLLTHRRWSVYVAAGATLELPLRSTVETTYFKDGQLIDTEHGRLRPHTQWSLGGGLGLHYDLTPTVGFFVEPSLQHYFHQPSDVQTWRTEHPLSLSLPLGVRITF